MIEYPEKPPQEFKQPAHINLEISDDELIEISETGLLALNLEEMKTIQSHYRDEAIQSSRKEVSIVENQPTDVELKSFGSNMERTLQTQDFRLKNTP